MPAPPSRTHPITVVGLGPGDPNHLTLAARQAIDAAPEVWLRTDRHPAVAALPTGIRVHTCDDLYEAGETFDAVYRAIATRLVTAARSGPVLYAVPGDPSTGELTVRHLRSIAAEAGATVTVLPGLSFVGPTLDTLGWDALDGLQLADATALIIRHHPDLDPDRPALVAQVYSRLVASDLKLVLMGAYPPDHPVTLVTGAGTDAAAKATVPLCELDHRESFGDLATLAVPALPYPGSLLSLAEVVAHLRAPDGCPWDRAQTHESLRPYLLEESYEVLEALDGGDQDELAAELGDLLLQIVLHAQLAVEGGDFSLADVVRHITEKIVRRHPHVFGDREADTPDDVRVVWEALKAEERAEKGQAADPFAGVPIALPALARAQAVLRKAGPSGAPYTDTESDPEPGVAQAVRQVLSDTTPTETDARASNVGAVLWAVVALAHEWDVDAEAVLREVTAQYVSTRRGTANDQPGEFT